LVNDISIASNEQASKISQINQGIIQVSKIVQTNSATSEEIAAASEELASQAEVLKKQVSRFNLKKGQMPSYFSYKGINNIDPNLLKMLEDMHDREKINNDMTDENSHEPVLSNSKEIEINGNDFGKY
jgi:methyl-accepting chemotaxis protein